MNSANDIQHIIYINIEHRTDRKQMFLTEMQKFDWAPEPLRFKAVEMKHGAVGCSISHVRCLEHAKRMNWSHVLICEDDIKFTDPDTFTENLNKFLSSGIEWDVILIGGNNVGRYTPTGQGAVRIKACQCALGYLVKNTYFDTLLQNFKEGAAQLIREPENKPRYAVDMYWFRLQYKDRWYLITPLTVTQQANYSNIEKHYTNYDYVMLRLDK